MVLKYELQTISWEILPRSFPRANFAQIIDVYTWTAMWLEVGKVVCTVMDLNL